MPAVKLVVLSQKVEPKFHSLARWEGRPFGGYKSCVDLRETEFKLPARLFSDGYRNDLFKIELIDVAHLGLSLSEEIVADICGDPKGVKIYRVNWAVDLLGIRARDLAACCKVAGGQHCDFEYSRSGRSFYPQRSFHRTVKIYEKLHDLLFRGDPLSEVFRRGDELTRFEIQLAGWGLPVRPFSQIRKYGEVELLNGISVMGLHCARKNPPLLKKLATERFRDLVYEHGILESSKMFRHSEWPDLCSLPWDPGPLESPGIRSLLKRSTHDWLEDRVRFPRHGYPASESPSTT